MEYRPMSKAIPDGYHTVTASLTVKDGAAAIEFYQRAFGAREIMRVNPAPEEMARRQQELFASMAKK